MGIWNRADIPVTRPVGPSKKMGGAPRGGRPFFENDGCLVTEEAFLEL